MNQRNILWVVVFAACAACVASAGTLGVYVGYADGLRGTPTFPNPWVGDPGTMAPGGSVGPYDAGAIMLWNQTGAPVTIDSVVYSSNGPTYNNVNLWGSFTIPDGVQAILTQNGPYNFDTSDTWGSACCTNNNPGGYPTFVVTIGGIPTTFNDTGLVTTTGNYDLAQTGTNEALGWRLVGTTGLENPNNQIPEPASLVLFGSGLLGVGRKAWQRFLS